MTKISQTKAAIDFAFSHFESDAITFAEASIQAFKSAGGNPADLQLWNMTVAQTLAQAVQLARQKLPSQLVAPVLVKPVTQPVAPPVSPNDATDAAVAASIASETK